MSRRAAAVSFAVLGGLLLLGVALAGPPAGKGDEAGPGGTLALRRFLARMGVAVREADAPPPVPGTFALLADLRDAREAGEILDWVESGGRLVLADPLSAIAERAGVMARERAGSFRGPVVLRPGCVAPEAVGVGRLAVHASDLLLTATGAASVACFPGSDGAFVVSVGRGRGTVVVLGGASPLTNELLREADNATLALRLFTTAPVVFGPPLPPGAAPNGPASGGLWGAVPGPAKVVLVQLGLAVAAFALARGRRLGRPVPEPAASPIPASELVRATGRLYRAARAAGFAGTLLREGTAARCARRLGLASSHDERLPEALARASGLPERRLRDVLAGPDPATDADLIRLAGDLEEVRRRVEGARS